MKIISFFIINIVLLNSALALTCSKDGLILLYVNGQENEKEDLQYTLTILQAETQITGLEKFDKSHVKINFSYNRTFGTNSQGVALADFMESLVLILASQPGVSIEEAWKAVYISMMNLYNPEDEEDRKLISNSGVLELIDREEVFEQLYAATVQDTEKLKTMILNNLEHDKKIILVGHSQGNLFINVSHQELLQNSPLVKDKEYLSYQKVIGNLQVASPTSNIAIPKHEWVTNHLDAILKVPSSLSPNFNLQVPINDTRTDVLDREKNHGFTNTYLSSVTGDIDRGNLPELKTFLFDQLISVAEKLESNCEGPRATFTYLVDADNPLKVKFTSEVTVEGGEEISEEDFFFEWDLIGNGIIHERDPHPSYTYSEPGTYTVKLTVKDKDGNESEPYFQDVEVKNSAEGCGGAPGIRIVDTNKDFFIADTATVDSAANISGFGLEICDNVKIEKNSWITGMAGSLKIKGNVLIGEGANIKNALGRDLLIEGDVQILPNASITAAGKINKNFVMKSNAWINVTSYIEITDNVQMDENTYISLPIGNVRLQDNTQLATGGSITNSSNLVTDSDFAIILKGNTKLNTNLKIGGLNPLVRIEGDTTLGGTSGVAVTSGHLTIQDSIINTYISLSKSPLNGLMGSCTVEINRSQIISQLECRAGDNSFNHVEITDSIINRGPFMQSYNGNNANLLIRKATVSNYIRVVALNQNASVTLLGPLNLCMNTSIQDRDYILDFWPAGC